MHCRLPPEEAAALLLLLLLSRLALAAAAAGLGPVVRCEPCDSRALEQCKPLAAECAELAREPGCGCCLTCALREGSPCGVYSERCGSGLSCQPRPGETRPLQALLEGRGVCANDTESRQQGSQPGGGPHVAAGNSSDSEDRNTSSLENQAITGPHRVQSHSSNYIKNNIIQKEQNKSNQRYKVDNDPQNTDTLNFSSESKLETEYGPCRREMESILNNLKITNILNPRGFHIPNCDKKGFYKKKQCRPSKGRKRGSCWCVDKYGQQLPGYDGKTKGDVQCYNLENK
ncbi:insulin-like growth factor-binding protein 3 [Microcaecilia unicolor]|uniref:Insulin-like growth factor-binding protein 3 n=1 Tax=Microcaecilia unicolor TaxID=1415580 RepID=A0A6P7Y244_9AMPH|nr:insulin-like growth factor-binding protein 3 [Microcaecilia unicolor]